MLSTASLLVWKQKFWEKTKTNLADWSCVAWNLSVFSAKEKRALLSLFFRLQLNTEFVLLMARIIANVSLTPILHSDFWNSDADIAWRTINYFMAGPCSGLPANRRSSSTRFPRENRCGLNHYLSRFLDAEIASWTISNWLTGRSTTYLPIADCPPRWFSRVEKTFCG